MKKKNLRVFSAGILSACFISAFAGCGEKAPYAVYSEASRKTSELESVEAVTTMDMTLSAQGTDMEIPMTANMKMERVNTKDMKLSIYTTMEIMDQKVEMNSYYTDGYYYLDSADSKIKYTMDLDEIQNQVASTTLQTTDLEEDDFKEISMEKKDDGQLITYTINGDSMTDIANSAFGALSELLAGADMQMDIQDISGTMTVNKDGYASAYFMHMPFTMEVQGQEMSINMDIDVTYAEPGKEVSAELPDDLDTYEEVDLNAIGGADGSTDITVQDSTESTAEE